MLGFILIGRIADVLIVAVRTGHRLALATFALASFANPGLATFTLTLQQS